MSECTVLPGNFAFQSTLTIKPPVYRKPRRQKVLIAVDWQGFPCFKTALGLVPKAATVDRVCLAFAQLFHGVVCLKVMDESVQVFGIFCFAGRRELVRIPNASVDGGGLAFAQLFHGVVCLKVMDESVQVFGIFCFAGRGELVRIPNASVDGGRLAFAQLFHDVFLLMVKNLCAFDSTKVGAGQARWQSHESR